MTVHWKKAQLINDQIYKEFNENPSSEEQLYWDIYHGHGDMDDDIPDEELVTVFGFLGVKILENIIFLKFVSNNKHNKHYKYLQC